MVESSNIDDVDWGNPINWSHPINRGLVSGWLAVPNRMGWGTGKWRDLVQRNNNHATMDSVMNPTAAWKPVGDRPAITFDGTDDNISFTANSALNVGSVLTVSIWFYTGSTSRQTVIGRETVASAWQVEMNTIAARDIGVIVEGTVIALTSGSQWSLNTWTHFCYTRTGTGAGTHAIYVNSTPRSLAFSNSINFTDTSTFRFGRRGAGSQIYNGSLASVFIWNRALPEASVASLYRTPPGILNRNAAHTFDYTEEAAGGGGGDAVPQCWAQYRRRHVA